MNKYNVGQRVQCISTDGTPGLHVGSIYTVTGLDTCFDPLDLVILAEFEGKTFYSGHFVPAPASIVVRPAVVEREKTLTLTIDGTLTLNLDRTKQLSKAIAIGVIEALYKEQA
jgi:hypothetical protein